AFQRQTAAETMTAILHDDVPDIPESGRVVPAALNRLIRRCLEKNPSERFQSARDLAFNLRAIADDARGAQEHDLTKPGRLRPMVWAAVILIGLAAVAAGLMWLKPRIPGPERSNNEMSPIDSVAVLPFVNEDPATEYLSDGITESLINNLSELPHFRVIARASVFRFKGRDATPQAVRHEFNLRAVLTGRVILHDKDLSISAELVDVKDNRHLWGERYHRAPADALQIEQDICRQIVDQLAPRLALLGDGAQQVLKHHTESGRAYEL